jgi:hypothetical protein
LRFDDSPPQQRRARAGGAAAAASAAVVAVPEARVAHPYWQRVLPQVWGWAKGDVLCLDDHPRRTFYALPNWAEVILLLTLGRLLFATLLLMQPYSFTNNSYSCSSDSTSTALLLLATSSCCWLLSAAASFIGMEVLLGGITCRAHSPEAGWGIAFLGACFPAAQDIARLLSKLRRGRADQLCLHFDWMDGQNGHVAAVRFALLVRSLAFSLMCLGGWWAFLFGSAAVAFWHVSQYCSKEAEVTSYLRGLVPLLLRNGGGGGRHR